MAVGNLVKRLQDIMRKDAGINGDAQRIEQMVWMFFLKVYDSAEEDWELVAEDNGEVVGAILCGHDGRYGYMYHVCVKDGFRRQGIGKAMVVFCMRALNEEHINKVALIAFVSNDAGNAFWHQIGWKRREDLNYYDFTLNEDNLIAFNE